MNKISVFSGLILASYATQIVYGSDLKEGKKAQLDSNQIQTYQIGFQTFFSFTICSFDR